MVRGEDYYDDEIYSKDEFGVQVVQSFMLMKLLQHYLLHKVSLPDIKAVRSGFG